MTRWDSPLFTVTFDDEAPPHELIWEAMIGSEGKTKTVKPNLATVTVRAYRQSPNEPLLTLLFRLLLRTLTIFTSLTEQRKMS